jgi:hypothetical protein
VPAEPRPRPRRRKAVEPEAPLGSLSQPRGPVPGPALCPGCSSGSLTRLSLPTRSTVPAVFVSCHDCERSGYYAADDGRELSRSTVLGEVGGEPTTPPSVPPAAPEGLDQ